MFSVSSVVNPLLWSPEDAAPALLVGQVGQRGPVGDAQQLQDPEDQVAIGMRIRNHDLRELPAIQPEDHIDHVQRVAHGARHHLGAPAPFLDR